MFNLKIHFELRSRGGRHFRGLINGSHHSIKKRIGYLNPAYGVRALTVIKVKSDLAWTMISWVERERERDF